MRFGGQPTCLKSDSRITNCVFVLHPDSVDTSVDSTNRCYTHGVEVLEPGKLGLSHCSTLLVFFGAWSNAELRVRLRKKNIQASAT